MLDLNPDQIFEQYKANKMDKGTLIKQMSSIIEEYDNDDDRVMSSELVGISVKY